MSVKGLLKNRCKIQRQSQTNSDGMITPGWSDNQTGVRCLVQEGRGRLRGDEAGEGLVYDAIGFFLPGTDIKPRGDDDIKDRIVMTKPSDPGTTYLVLKVGDESGMENHLTAYLQRVTSK